MTDKLKNFWVKQIIQSAPLMAVFTLPCQEKVGIGECIAEIYTVSLTLVGIVAFVQIVIGGFLVLTAAGNTSKYGEAMNRIKNAVFGIVLLFSSYLILRTINPDLIKLNFAFKKVDQGSSVDSIIPSSIGDLSVTPTLAALSIDQELKFSTKVFSSAQRIANVCGSGASGLVARVDLLTADNQRQVINFSNFSKENFGTGEKSIPWSFTQETQTVVNLLAAAGDTNDNKTAKFEFVLACPGSNNFIFRTAPVTVLIATQR